MLAERTFQDRSIILTALVLTSLLLAGSMVLAARTGASSERSPLPAGGDTEKLIISLGRHDNRVMDHLDHLTDRIGPRLAGSQNHRVAVEWARDTFEEFGLSNVHLEKCGEIPVGFERGGASGRILTPLSRELHFTTPAWSAGTGGTVRARAVIAPENPDNLTGMEDRLDGAWILRRPIDDPAEYEEFMEKWGELDIRIAGMIIPSKGERFPTFGNHRIEWAELPVTPQVILLESEWLEIADLVSIGEEVILEFDIRNEFVKGPIPLYNVVADIPGTEFPDEYVIVGAHIDSWDAATGANDNGTGVAATMEAARLLKESGVKPKRTIRFILFAGEEIGMYGSRGYVRDHPDLMEKISAVLVMDQGGDYIRGIMATEAISEDFEEVFAPVITLNEEMPFEIKKVEHLPRAAECGKSQIQADQPDGENSGGEQVVRRSCGAGPLDASQLSGCAGGEGVQLTGSTGEPRIVVAGTAAEADSLLEAMGIDPSSRKKGMMIAVGSSDYAPFLNAGVPGFMWDQSGDVPYGRYVHSQYDTFETVIPEYIEHSTTVVALAAYGMASLDHLLSREHLLAPGEPVTTVPGEKESCSGIKSE